jgi:dihydroneopterin aldolase
VGSDWIFLRGLAASARIGGVDGVPWPLEVDVDASIDLAPAAGSDCLSDTVNYAELAREVMRTLGRSCYDSLADAADAVAASVMMTDRKIGQVHLTLRAPRVVLHGAVVDLHVSVTRPRIARGPCCPTEPVRGAAPAISRTRD